MTARDIAIEQVSDPDHAAQHRAQRERFDQNVAWLRAHAREVYAAHRGRCIAVAGQELFVADTPHEVRALAKAAHPEDDGAFVRYIPHRKVARIYASAG